MKLKQHLEIGNKVLDEGLINTFKVNRIAYLFGNIAPDLNCIYPAHRLKTTEKRFYKRLKRVEKSSTPLIKSFTLGVITHYICDYFCYAHNIESLGVPHKKYETNLYNYYESHLNEMAKDYDTMIDNWVSCKRQSNEECIVDGCMTVDKHCKFILSQIKYMNSLYMNGCDKNKKGNWTTKIEQMQKDIEYTTFMIEHILTITLEPFKCMVGEY